MYVCVCVCVCVFASIMHQEQFITRSFDIPPGDDTEPAHIRAMQATLQQTLELAFVGQRAPNKQMPGHAYNGLEFCQVGSLCLQIVGTRQIACAHYDKLAKSIEKQVQTDESFQAYCYPDGTAKFSSIASFLKSIDKQASR